MRRYNYTQLLTQAGAREASDDYWAVDSFAKRHENRFLEFDKIIAAFTWIQILRL
jgi:hypothetical protein